MKKLIFIIVLASLIGCNPKEDKPTSKVEKKEMSYQQLAKEIGGENAFNVFDSSGRTESDPVARGGRRVKPGAVIVVWLNDIVLSGSSSELTYTTSPDAYIGGVTRFVTMSSNDGAMGIWSCNRRWDFVTPDPSVTCSDPGGSGFYRAFTADKVTYNVHISNVIN